MGDMLSQDEINALLGGGITDADDGPADTPDYGESTAMPSGSSSDGMNLDDLEGELTPEQRDIIGEIGNISMGTSATTLFALLSHKVMITTPQVTVKTWRTLYNSYKRPCVGIKVGYKVGINGSNVLVLKQHDVKIISNLMMGGDGVVGDDEELNELDLSAIAEAMNQMVGSASTSLSTLLNMKVDIDTPHAAIMEEGDSSSLDDVGFEMDDIVVCTSFKMEVDTLINSQIMQIVPKEVALMMIEALLGDVGGTPEPETAPAPPPPPPQTSAAPPPPPPPPGADPMQGQVPGMDPYAQQGQMPMQGMPMPGMDPYAQQGQMPMQGMPMPGMDPYAQQGGYYPPPGQYPQMPPPQYMPPQPNINAQPVTFQNFDMAAVVQQKENMDIIREVPLEVTVELGRTNKKIKEILEFTPGTIIELDKLAGEPIDILVNGKFVAKGEVVVIDENFGIRITDIISVENRI